MRFKEKGLAILLSLVMVFTFMPAMAFAEGEGSIATSYNLYEPEVGDTSERLTWMEGDSGFYAIPGDILIIDGNTYTCDDFTFTHGDDVLEQGDYWFECKKGDEWYYKSEAPAGKYDLYIMFANENYQKALISEVTITECPYESAEYIPAKSTYTLAELDKFKETGDDWVAYYIDTQVGDKLIVKEKGGETKTFVAKEIPYEDDGQTYYDVVFELGDDNDPHWFQLWHDENITSSAGGSVNEFYTSLYNIPISVPITVIGNAPQPAPAVNPAAQAEALAEANFQGTPDSSVPAVKKAKVKSGKKSFSVSWKKASKKQLKKFDKVEVQYSTNKSFPRTETKVKEVKKSKKSLKVKGLAKKSTYYVRVRDIKYVNGVKHVGKWAKAKKVKIK